MDEDAEKTEEWYSRNSSIEEAQEKKNQVDGQMVVNGKMYWIYLGSLPSAPIDMIIVIEENIVQ